MNQNSLSKLLSFALLSSSATFGFASGSLLNQIRGLSPTIGTTVPANGDVNPYGVAFVPDGFPTGGRLSPGDVLVSNFNNSANLQGTGTTIVKVDQTGKTTQFFQGKGLGLTTALGVLRNGFVLVGNVPTQDGTATTIGQGSLLVLDRNGRLVTTLRSALYLDGPWDLTIHEVGPFAQVYVSNVLSGTITRMDVVLSSGFNVLDMMEIASGYEHEPNDAALVLGPTGLAYDANKDMLYVASTADNAIYGIPNASWTTADDQGNLVYRDNAHLRGPLGLVLAPNGNLITTNGDAVNANSHQPSEMIEFTTAGVFIAMFSVDSSGEGGAFGLALRSTPTGVQLAAVDDVTNSLKLWTVSTAPPAP